MHVLAADLRSESLFYSVRDADRTSYRVLHDGEVTDLATYPQGRIEGIGVYAGSRYGFENSYANRLDVRRYYDEVLQRQVDTAPEGKPPAGAVRALPVERHLPGQRARPSRSGSGWRSPPSGALLVSTTLPGGGTVNFHSEGPAKRLDGFVTTDLSGETVLPVMAR